MRKAQRGIQNRLQFLKKGYKSVAENSENEKISDEEHAFFERLLKPLSWDECGEQEIAITPCAVYIVTTDYDKWFLTVQLQSQFIEVQFNSEQEAKEAARKHFISMIAGISDMYVIPIWRGIDDVPEKIKDEGTVILVTPSTYNDGSQTASLARWEKDRFSKNPRPYWERMDSLGRVLPSRNNPPKKWMPLPPAPDS